MDSGLRKWFSAHREEPRFGESLRVLLGYAFIDVFRRSFPQNPPFSPEKALSQALLLPRELLPEGFADWVGEPEAFAEKILEFCENSRNFNLKPLSEEDFLLDLRGVPCPKNAVRSLLVLAGLSENAELSIYLDGGAPIENVPQALIGRGHQVVFREKKGDYWYLKIRKGQNPL
ncbi:MAG: sulfurtransferase TusA family protein [Fibrobacter sp.]|nr:sulfurtransferase TusA family protein [Fibrobacter sp.]